MQPELSINTCSLGGIDLISNLHQLKEEILQCEKCDLYRNGKILPYIGEYAQYILLLDFIKHDMDDCMDSLWELFKKVGLSKQEFVVMYTTQCIIKSSNRGGKLHTSPPSKIHREECKKWLWSFIMKMENPKMLVMGNIAMEHVTGDFSGIVEKNATITKPKISGIIIPCVLSVGPSYLKKFGPGYSMVKKSLEVFKYL